MEDATSRLLAAAEALTIRYELEPEPALEDGYTPETAAWFERHAAAADDLAAEARSGLRGPNAAAALRAAHGPPWDGDEPHPLPLGLLVFAALKLER